jgi:hypothetical protein
MNVMDKIALNVPGLSGDTNIPNPEGLQFSGPAQTSAGYVLSQFLNLTFTIAIILSFIWFVWGAYEYIVAQGTANSNSTRWWGRHIVGFVTATSLANFGGSTVPGSIALSALAASAANSTATILPAITLQSNLMT